MTIFPQRTHGRSLALAGPRFFAANDTNLRQKVHLPLEYKAHRNASGIRAGGVPRPG